MQNNNSFLFDIFLSHSSKDKKGVRELADRLKADGLRVWLDQWEIRAGANFPAKIEEGLEQSRVLVLCMSANAFGSEWSQLEAGTFRFRDPLNKGLRFIPLRLDNAPIKGSLAQFAYIRWLPADREREYAKLLEACRPEKEEVQETGEPVRQSVIKLVGINSWFFTFVFSPDRKQVLTGCDDGIVRLWEMKTGRCLREFKGHTKRNMGVAWSNDLQRALSSSTDKTIRLWDMETGNCLRVFKGHSAPVFSVVWSVDQKYALSGSGDNTLRLWDIETGACLRVFKGHTDRIYSVVWLSDQRYALSGSYDNTMRLWDVGIGHCLRVFEGHTSYIDSITVRADQCRVLTASDDDTVRLWDLHTGKCLQVLEGHTIWVRSVVWHTDQRHALSGSGDKTVRLWDVETGRCLYVFEGHNEQVHTVAWSADGQFAYSGDVNGYIRIWDLSKFISKTQSPVTSPDHIQYTNAKVLLVGDTSAGKTGLSMRLAQNKWEPSDSTVGAWATHWKLPVSSKDRVQREIWLWDFGGQADQRLIHQLYMKDTALAVLVFDGQKEDLFETLGQWDRDLTRASNRAFTKLLVAGRVDAGGLRVSRNRIMAFAKERGYIKFLETSAKQDICCEELKQAILEGIQWENIPWRSSPLLFKRLKDEILRLKDAGRVLMRFNELQALVGEVISTVALAGQISREFNVSDHGIDMEIEFKDDDSRATGQKLYLQLKSGDSYLRERKSDGTEIFRINKKRHVQYWMEQKFPVLLVIRTSEGEVRWMEIRNWLKQASANGKKPVKQIVFKGERFDVMSVRRWREKMLY